MSTQQEDVIEEIIASLKAEAGGIFGDAPAGAKLFVEEYFGHLRAEGIALVSALAARDSSEADRIRTNITFIVGNVQGKLLQLALIAKTQFSLETLLTVAGNLVLKLAPKLIALI